MALSKITITEGDGGTGRVLTSNDNKSGLIIYGNTAKPAGLTGSTSVTVFSLSEAESLGVSSTYASGLPHYHVSEFYRINPSGQLQLMVVNYSGGTHNFNEVATLQTDADGELNQIGIWTRESFSTAQVSTLQSKLTTLKSEDVPAIGILAANVTATTLTSLADLSGSNAPLVSVVIGQDGGNDGKDIYASTSKSVSCLGAFLGAIGRSQVHESVSWKGQFDMSGEELDTLSFSNGTSYKSVSKTQLGQLNDRKYIFLLKDVGLNGSYFNSSFTSVADTSDYFSIERNRTINKARRLLRTALLPELNSPLYLDDSGKLRIETIAKFTSLCEQALDGMRRAGELSNYRIDIDPNQDVLSDDTLTIAVRLLPVGVARYINITLGYTLSLS